MINEDGPNISTEAADPAQTAAQDTSGAAAGDSGLPAQTAKPDQAAAASSSSGPAAATAAPEQKHKDIFHGLLDVLGGTSDKHYSVDKDSGKTVVTTTPRKPGSQFAHIVAAALTGVAATAGDHGPGAGIGELGKGAKAEMDDEQKDEDRKRAHAQTEAGNQRQADEMTLRKAANAREQLESLNKATEFDARFKKFGYDFDQEQAHDKQELSDRWSARQQAGVKPLMIDGKQVPEFSTLKEANDFAAKNTKAVIGGFTTRIDVDPDTHKFVLGQVPQDKQMFEVSMPDGKGGTTKGTIFATPSDYLGFVNKQSESKRDAALATEANLRIQSMSIDVKDKKQFDAASTNWRKSLQATGNDPEKAVEYLKSNYPSDAAFLQQHELDTLSEKGGVPIFSGGFGEMKDPFGEQLPVKAHKDYTKEMAAFQKEYVLPANAVEKSYQMSDTAYREYMKARAQGKSLGSGAQSMIMLSNHLNTTFGQVKGARITKDMIHEHLGARSISDDALVTIQKLVNGDALSPEQWQSYHELISQSRNEQWKLAADNALNQGLPRNFLPRGNGRPIDEDPATAQLFYELGGQSPQKARQAAQYFGWKMKPEGSK